jgi:hypothetical protein
MRPAILAIAFVRTWEPAYVYGQHPAVWKLNNEIPCASFLKVLEYPELP